MEKHWVTRSLAAAQGRWDVWTQPARWQWMVAPLSCRRSTPGKGTSAPISSLHSQPHGSARCPVCGRCRVARCASAGWMRLLCWSICGAAGSETVVLQLLGRARISLSGCRLTSLGTNPRVLVSFSPAAQPIGLPVEYVACKIPPGKTPNG